MSHRYASRLRRYAFFSALQLAVVVIALAGAAVEPVAFVVAIVVALGLFWAWGPFQAEVALNPRFDDVDRRRWRLRLALLPGATAAYWYLHLRPFAP